MRSLNNSPDDSESAGVGLLEGLGVLCSVNKCYSLAHVEIGVFAALDSIQLQDSMVAVLLGQRSSVASEHGLGVQSDSS